MGPLLPLPEEQEDLEQAVLHLQEVPVALAARQVALVVDLERLPVTMALSDSRVCLQHLVDRNTPNPPNLLLVDLRSTWA